jgi:ABC-type bacteriocin/lantibiotic exporter with double-glycine peptidase domain
MNYQTSQKIQLNVPYFQQTRHATCGPAALMMILKYYTPTFELTRKNETHLWRHSRSLLLFGATLQYRLAILAQHNGFHTHIYQQTHATTTLEKILSQPAKKAHIPITYTPDITKIIPDSLKNKTPPLILLNLQPINNENVYHWLVVTGIDNTHIYVNDPYIPQYSSTHQKKDYPIPHTKFHKALNYPQTGFFHLPSAALLINK